MNNKTTLLLPVALITVGAGWLLSSLGTVPSVDWIWTLGLAVIGLLTFVMGGFDKVTVVIGPFFMLAGILSVLRQTNRLTLSIELPLLIIATGILLLVAHAKFIPAPTWFTKEADESA